MSTEPINYEAVIADLEAKRAHLDSMIAGLRAVAGMGSLGTSPNYRAVLIGEFSDKLEAGQEVTFA